MVQESRSKSNLQAFSAVNSKDTGNLLGNRNVGPSSGKQYGTASTFGSTSKSADKNAQMHGAWGSVYKNKSNFVNMHLC